MAIIRRKWSVEFGKHYRHNNTYEPFFNITIKGKTERSAKSIATTIAKNHTSLGDMVDYYLNKYNASNTYAWKPDGDGFIREIWFPKSEGEFYKDVVGGFAFVIKLKEIKEVSNE